MPGNNSDGETKKKKGDWDPASMHKAVQKVLSNEISARRAAELYQVPRTTLNDRISAIKNSKEVSIKPVMGRFHKTFSSEHEEILAEHVKDLANRLMPLNKQEFKSVEYAKRGKSLLSGQDTSKKGKNLVSGKDVSKKGKNKKKENQSPPHRPIEEKTICPLCLESHEEDWIQCGNCKVWVHEACANISELTNQYICDFCLV